MSAIDRHVGMRLASLREGRRFSLLEVAQGLELEVEQLPKLESGQIRIEAGLLFSAAKYFDVPIAYFFERVTLMAPSGVPDAGMVERLRESE